MFVETPFDVFISYKREQRSLARRLARALACYGVSTWYDKSLLGGEDFERQLRTQMELARVIVVLWCPLSVSVEESYVLKVEAPEALRAGKLLPVKIQDCKLPDDFAKIHTFDLVSWRRGPKPTLEFVSLIERLGQKLERPLAFDEEEGVRFSAVLEKHKNPGSREPFRDSAPYTVPWMLSAPEGCFNMGSPEEGETERGSGKGEEHPEWQRSIFFDRPFAISRSPVTVAEFSVFSEAIRCDFGRGARVCRSDRLEHDSGANWLNPGFSQEPDHPVTCVSWYEAEAYAEWLSTVTAQKYRLPSEAEWEYAARARQRGPYAFGDRIEATQANFDSRVPCAGQSRTWSYRRGSTRVGSFEPKDPSEPKNEWGLWDVHGNVAEWCQDVWHHRRAHALQDGTALTDHRKMGAADDQRVIRGGSWRDPPKNLRFAARGVADALDRYNHVGFRVARELEAVD